LKKDLSPEQEKERKQRDRELNAIYLSASMKDELRGLAQSMGVESYESLLRLLLDVFNKFGPQYIAEEKSKK
jgi:hypothetical protein